MGLHRPIPAFPPYSDSSLFYILPLPEHTDRLGRPVIVLSLRHVRRDEHGKMDDMKQWSWWALELVRRTLHDYWSGQAWQRQPQKQKQKCMHGEGVGGEGCIMLVDASGSSYRNLVSWVISLSYLSQVLTSLRRWSCYRLCCRSATTIFPVSLMPYLWSMPAGHIGACGV